jgi:hypothetical protein
VAIPFGSAGNNSGGTTEAIETTGVSISEVLVMDNEDTNGADKSIIGTHLFLRVQDFA